MESKNGNIIEFRKVEKSFDSQKILDQIDLAIERGKTTVVIGRSGTGKSVLLKHITCLLRPDAGEVFFDNQRIDQLSERQLIQVRARVGFLFQGGALFDSMRAVDNVIFPLRDHRRISYAQAREFAMEKLSLVGMADHEDKWPGQLSGCPGRR